jgi:Domain of unknown function (DUF5916)/Carbohydrate family 9 binding domain-like
LSLIVRSVAACLLILLGSGIARATPLPPARALPGRSPARIEAGAVADSGADAVKLDGELTEGAWERAEPIRGFVQRDPKEGAAPAFETEVRVLYDRRYLYVGVRAFDRDPGKIVGIRTRRDGTSPSDWIRVMIDSYHDRRTAYEFAVNPAGVKQDAYWFADSSSDSSWDAVWDVSVTRDDTGWRAEFRIPFSQLRFEPGKADTFGFAVLRQVGRLNETSSWPLLAKSKPGFVSQMGELGGLALTGAAKRLEVVPYSVGQVEARPAGGNPFVRRADPSGAIGVDLKYAVTPGLTLTSTVNPDFGQVEADPAVVNLTAFETFYQERRPFFVEGSGNLQFDLDCNDGQCTGLFYSRRIGRQPHASPDAPAGGYVSSPGLTTIIGAAKLTGRAGAFAIGALDAVTGREDARLAGGLGQWTQTVEPLTNYTVAQAKREWSNQSSVGFAFTNTARRLDQDVSFLPSHATTGGVNWDWRMKDPRYSVTGYWAGSSVRGSAEAIDELQRNAVHNLQRPDAAYLGYNPARTSLNGHAGSVGFQKIGGAKVRFSVNGSYKTPGFDVNDVGYVRRADEIAQSAWVQVRWDTPTKVYRNVRINFNQWAGWNFGGDSRFRGANVNGQVVLASNWAAGGGLNVEGAGVDDRATRGGPALRSKGGGNVWYFVQTDGRKAVNGLWQGFVYKDQLGDVSWGFDPELVVRPTAFVSVSGGVHFERDNEDAQWVENVADGASTHYVFGRLRQTTVGLTARLNYTVTPALTLQVYAQPFVSAGAYSNFKQVVRPRAAPFASQFGPYAYSGEPDFNYRSFRMTNVLRWEYKPGSALYVVWQQVREDTASVGAFRFSADLHDLFGLPATNVFLVKFSCWLNL